LRLQATNESVQRVFSTLHLPPPFGAEEAGA